MSIESKYLQKWTNEVALELNLPPEVVSEIFKSQTDFIVDTIRNKKGNIHITGLGKFFCEKDRTTPQPRHAIKPSDDPGSLEETSDRERLQHTGSSTAC